MPNTLSPNPDMITLDRDDSVWQYPAAAERGEVNPAALARAEYEHGLYVDAIASDTPEAVNQYETVPAADEITGYATNSGNAIDPAHSEAVVAAAQASVENAFATDPDMVAMQRANEQQRLNREHHAEALVRATALTQRIGDMQDRALLDWGAEGEA